MNNFIIWLKNKQYLISSLTTNKYFLNLLKKDLKKFKFNPQMMVLAFDLNLILMNQILMKMRMMRKMTKLSNNNLKILKQAISSTFMMLKSQTTTWKKMGMMPTTAMKQQKDNKMEVASTSF